MTLGRGDEHELPVSADDGRPQTRELARLARENARLRERQSRMRSVLDSVAEGILTTDADGVIDEFNAACASIFGVRVDEMVGRNLASLLADAGAVATLLTVAPPSGIELLGRRRDGTAFPLELSVSRFEDGAGRYTIVVRDLTERKRLERRLRHAQKLEAVGRLASGVAHDFNNLLMGIAGCADIALAKAGEASNLGHYLREIKRAAIDGRSIAAQLLAFGRDRDEGYRPLVLDRAVEATANMLRRLVGEDVGVTVQLDAGTATVSLRPGELDELLMNLVANARDAMPEGGALTITTRCAEVVADGSDDRPEPGSYVVLRVADTGCGMDEQVVEYALEPFFTTKPVGGGVGLGLSTVYGIVRRAGGHVDIDSEPGEGTSVSLWLPCSVGAARAGGEPKVAHRGRPGGTILVVEDESLVLLTVRHYLERAGYRVLTARSGPEAVDCCSRFPGPIDLLLTDMVLPGMSGQAVARRAAELKPGVVELFMSAHPRETLEVAGRLEADAELIQKPFTADELLERISDLLSPGR